MIKHTTVIKRMIARGWKPALTIVGTITAISAASLFAEKTLGWDFDTVYWGLLTLVFVVGATKSYYDWQRMEIEFEQNKMLRDLGKQND